MRRRAETVEERKERRKRSGKKIESDDKDLRDRSGERRGGRARTKREVAIDHFSQRWI
jgi:hypothetical protein